MIKVIDDFRGAYRWLSNFHLSPVELDGLIYPSTEHAFQAAKTLSLEERDTFKFLTARQAKLQGRASVLTLPTIRPTKRSQRSGAKKMTMTMTNRS